MPPKKPIKPIKAADPMDSFMSQVGAKSGAVSAPTAAQTARIQKNVAYQQGANARAAAATAAVPKKKKKFSDNITGFQARRKMAKDVLGG